MSTLRFTVVREAFKKKAAAADTPSGLPSSYFGELVFTREKMQKYLDAKTYKALIDSIEEGAAMDRATADRVAEGMKTWAIEHGVTHITHWFQPLTDVTAEKHESMMAFDARGRMIEQFDGSSLIQQEPDASSFPNGGLRATFEARGYTAWDPTSPVFIHDDTLCIPTVFISYTGEALDYKTPLKKALKAVSEAALPLCQLFDPQVRKVISYLGWEQEFFLVDADLYSARADLVLSGRTLMGHESSKNQQLDDHYFGAIPERVAAFIREIETEGYRLGIPLKTSHNEVAPNQFEIAPVYGEANLSNDQNQLMMNIMNKAARKHGFVLLLHEKPFAGINGSGKHCNWSLGTDTGTGLLAPGHNPAGNLQFLIFFVNTLMAVQRHNGLLKASIASATNAHRLGGNEAPPAIVSAFIGNAMTDVLKRLLELPSGTPVQIAGKKGKSLGIVEIPEIFVDNTDRNRTSPFAFTGNRFEFRAVGSSANCAGALTTLNAAMAEQLTDFKAILDREMASGKRLEVAAMDALKPIIASTLETIVFEGNGYSDAWKAEAARRGLDTETSVPEMFLRFTDPASVAMFTRMGVYSEKELRSRNEVKWEIYCKKVQIEARVMGRMAINHILPAALNYKARLSESTARAQDIFGRDFTQAAATELYLIRRIGILTEEVRERVDRCIEARKAANRLQDLYEKAKAYQEVALMLEEMRGPIDELEEIVDDGLWPLPKYRELLFTN